MALKSIALLLIGAMCLATSSAAAEDESREFRRGFTLEWHLMGGQERVEVEALESSWESGLGDWFNPGLGAFLNPDLALGVQFLGLRSESRLFDAPREIKSYAGLLALSAQSWKLAPYKLEAGAGVAVFDSNALLTNNRTGESFFDADYGWGVYAAAFMPIARRGAHRLELGLQWTVLWFDVEDVQQISILFGYQLF